jgi:hypothetical protein
MSLHIDIDQVHRVLLSDGWHEVLNDSFILDSYEYIWLPEDITTLLDAEVVHGGGRSGICATGFRFIEGFQISTPRFLAGPLTAIQAVEYTEREMHLSQIEVELKALGLRVHADIVLAVVQRYLNGETMYSLYHGEGKTDTLVSKVTASKLKRLLDEGKLALVVDALTEDKKRGTQWHGVKRAPMKEETNE